jgi:uncharacterized membrane protein YfcA
LSPHLLLALALSTLIGVSLGLLGAGGSLLAVPVLVYVARLEVRSARWWACGPARASTPVGCGTRSRCS